MQQCRLQTSNLMYMYKPEYIRSGHGRLVLNKLETELSRVYFYWAGTI